MKAIKKINGRTKSVDWKKIVVDSLYMRDLGVCRLCNKPLKNDQLFEIDHIVERYEGGEDTFQNLRLVHLTCHKMRHQTNRYELPIPKTPTMNNNGKMDYKKKIHIELLSHLQTALSEHRTLKEAAESVGVTLDQARYYISLYKLDYKQAKYWNLSTL